MSRNLRKHLFSTEGFSLKGIGWPILGCLVVNLFWWLFVLCLLTPDA